jgi:hypothetical protein
MEEPDGEAYLLSTDPTPSMSLRGPRSSIIQETR